MRGKDLSHWVSIIACAGAATLLGCGAPPATNTGNTNINAASPSANSNVNTNANVASTSSSSVDAREPDQYQATVTIKVEAMGAQQPVTMPTLAAKVARSGNDRRMEFTIPAGGRVVYLDKGENKYLILPDKNQYAELNNDSTGFDIRRMMTPGEIVKQVKSQQGLQLVGDDTLNGRAVTKYRYAATANTQSQAGNVNTESYLYVDKDTGLPLRSETTSQATGNVQGYNGLRVVTEMSDLTSDAPADLFAVPTNMQKIEAEQVRAQVNVVFQALAAVIGQLLQQSQTGQQPQPSATASPAR
ncbi:MAG: hypothetical protein ACJ73D_06120 [Pyrinomonadaceae bacterium]